MRRTVLALLMIFSLLLACCALGEEQSAGEKTLAESFGDYLHTYPSRETANSDGSFTEIYTGISLDVYNAYREYLRKRPEAIDRARIINESEGENKSILADFVYDKARVTLSTVFYTETEELHITYPLGVYDARTRAAKEQFGEMVVLTEAGSLKQAAQAYRKIPEQSVYAPAVEYIAAHPDLAAAISQNRFQVAGETVAFGRWEQDGDTANGPEDIQWLVIDVREGQSLLLSKYALDTRPYNAEYGPVTWETSSLRGWLNGEFASAAFSEKEQTALLESETDNGPEQGAGYPTDGGAATRDRVFLLSFGEVNRYFAGDGERKCLPTAYAASRGAFTSPDAEKSCGWWLRSPGSLDACAMRVSSDGSLRSAFADYEELTVRPALWIDLNSDFF